MQHTLFPMTCILIVSMGAMAVFDSAPADSKTQHDCVLLTDVELLHGSQLAAIKLKDILRADCRYTCL